MNKFLSTLGLTAALIGCSENYKSSQKYMEEDLTGTVIKEHYVPAVSGWGRASSQYFFTLKLDKDREIFVRVEDGSISSKKESIDALISIEDTIKIKSQYLIKVSEKDNEFWTFPKYISKSK